MVADCLSRPAYAVNLDSCGFPFNAQHQDQDASRFRDVLELVPLTDTTVLYDESGHQPRPFVAPSNGSRLQEVDGGGPMTRRAARRCDDFGPSARGSKTPPHISKKWGPTARWDAPRPRSCCDGPGIGNPRAAAHSPDNIDAAHTLTSRAASYPSSPWRILWFRSCRNAK